LKLRNLNLDLSFSNSQKSELHAAVAGFFNFFFNSYMLEKSRYMKYTERTKYLFCWSI